MNAVDISSMLVLGGKLSSRPGKLKPNAGTESCRARSNKDSGLDPADGTMNKGFPFEIPGSGCNMTPDTNSSGGLEEQDHVNAK
jgi:hypothetical protein